MRDTPGAPASSSRYPWYVLGVLVAVYIVHHIDRVVISLLFEPIKHEFSLSDTQLGLFGIGYAFAFGLAGLPIGMLVDRVHRVRLLAGLLAVWSGLTALCAYVTGFWSLLLARIGVGVAESGGTPTNVSILSDYFPPRRRSTAFGIYYTGSQFGGAIGFSMAAVVAAEYGWRAAFLAAGLPGLLLMLLVLASVREPVRGQADSAPATAPENERAPGFGTVVRTLWRDRAVFNMIAGVTIPNVIAAGVATWLAAFMMRTHGVPIRDAGFAIAGLSLFGAVGSIVGGIVADRIGRRGVHRVPLLLGACALATIPGVVGGLLSPTFAGLLAGFAVQMVAHAMLVAPGYAATLSLVPVRMRGVTASMLQVLSNMLGFGVGTQFVGSVSDGLKPALGTDSLRAAMILLAVTNVWTMWHFLRASRAMRARESLGGP
ncbi:MAG: MFS transporter [Gammaproteobacteria bacterium]